MRKRKRAIHGKTMKAFKSKIPYSSTAEAIEKKLKEIKKEAGRKGAATNQPVLFRYWA